MKKRILSLVIVLALLMSFVTVVASATTSGTCGDNLTWTLDDEGTLTISGTGYMGDWTYYSVPWYSLRSNIKKVIIGDSVITIGDNAFCDCSSLTSVTIGNGITIIGESAFEMCSNLTDITIPDDVTTIGERAFRDCYDLSNVTIGNNVTTIGESAFSRCRSLTDITIPDGVTTICSSAFVSCSSLTSVTIPDSVTTIGVRAFNVCSSLTTIIVNESNKNYAADENGVLYNKEKTTLIQYPIGNERTSFVIPDGVTTIDSNAFYGCSSLISIIIPDSVTTIGYEAFYGCEKLTSVIIGDSVTMICNEAFGECSGLTSVTIPGSVTTIGEWAFLWCDSLTDVYYLGSEADWSEINIDWNNSELFNATIHYPSEFSESGSADFDKDNNKIILYSPTAVSDATIFVAIYNGGKMVGMKSMLVDIAPGENTFDSPITNYSGATETKIMVWNTIESLTPLIEQCTVEVE